MWRVPILVAFCLALGAACGGPHPSEQHSDIPVETTSSVPKTITVSGGVPLEAINARVTLNALVQDQSGATVPGARVTWSSNKPLIASVNEATGEVTAVANGAATISATVGGIVGSTSVTVAQRATQLARAGGEGQVSVVATQLPAQLSARVSDSLGTVVQGALVTFVVISGGGGGGLDQGTSTSDVGGLVAVRWTLGTVSTPTYRVRATLQLRPTATVDFTATAIPDTPSSLAKVSGDRQSAPQLTAVPLPIVVVVTDRFGNAVNGVGLDFVPNSGSGNVTPTSASTTAVGDARTTWTLGAAVSGSTSQTLTVRGKVVALTPVTFTATATRVQSDTSAGIRRPP
jgi:hypothetical protein